MPKAAGAPLPVAEPRPAVASLGARTQQVTVALLFAIAIAVPLAVNVTGRDGADAQAENRELASFPALNGTIESIATFPHDFSRWFEDHFGLRAALIRWHGVVTLRWLHTSPSSAVVVGRDGWLFYADDNALDDYASDKLMGAGQVGAWRDTIARADRFVRARGGAYVFTIAPDKHVVYPEEMPPTIHRVSARSRMDQVFDALAQTGVSAVDLRPALDAAKARERIYQLTDTHWNDRGALVAYQQIIQAVRRQDPAVPSAWTREDFEPLVRVTDGRDLAGMLGLTRVLRETDLTLAPRRPRHARVVEPAGADPTAEEGRLVTEIPGSTLPRAVIFRDSFTSPLVPFLSEHFSRAVYLWQNDFDPAVVETERADIVLQEIVGRHLYGYYPSPELIPQ